MKTNNERPMLTRTATDIMVAAAKIVDMTEYCHSEVVQIARLAFFHRVQTDLWLKYRAKYPDLLTAIVICTFGSACSPEVAVFFKDGTKIRKFSEEDWLADWELDEMVYEAICDYEMSHATK